MDDEITAQLTDAQKAQLHEVADLMLKIYHTLAQTRYIDPSWIIEGPHDLAHLSLTCRSLDIDESIIYLYSILPYIDPVNVTDFFMGTEFADFRKETDLERSRDPFYSPDEEEHMAPWMTPLASLGCDGAALIYSAKSHRIWFLDQSLVSWDINLYDGWAVVEYDSDGEELEPEPKSDMSDMDDESDDEVVSAREMAQYRNMAREMHFDEDDDIASSHGDGDGDGSDENMSSPPTDAAASITDDEMGDEQDEEGGDEENSNDEDNDGADDVDDDEGEEQIDGIFDERDYRPAPDVLKDITAWFRKVKTTPGSDGHWTPEYWQPDVARPLLIKHGWPKKFDGDAFQIDQARLESIFDAWYAVSRQRVEQFKWDITDRDNDRRRLGARLSAATTTDHQWLAKMQLFQHQLAAQGVVQNLQEAEDRCKLVVSENKRASPMEEDWPLWELKKMGESLSCAGNTVDKLAKTLEKMRQEPGTEGSDEPELRQLEKELAHAQRKLAIYERAMVVSRSNAERLCSGRTVDELYEPSRAAEKDQHEFERELELKRTREHAAALEKWMVGIPVEAKRTRKKASEEMKRLKDRIQGLLQCL